MSETSCRQYESGVESSASGPGEAAEVFVIITYKSIRAVCM